MKPTHYDYKHIYYVLSDDPERKIEPKASFSINRGDLNLVHTYYVNGINIYTKDKEMEKFCLGMDFSPPGSQLLDRCEDRLFLNFIIRGKGTLDGQPFSAGQFYYTKPLQTHTVMTDPDDPFVSVWLSVEGTYSGNIVKQLQDISSDTFMTVEHRADVMKLTKTLLYDTNLGEHSIDYLKSVITLYLDHLKPNAASNPTNVVVTKKVAQLIRESKIYVRKNLKHVTVSEMAAAQHYNTNYFSRVFTAAMGITPLEYITDCKMDWAKNSLIYSNLTIDEIIEAIGYDHRNGFTIAFKKKYGVPPAAYRKAKQSTSSIERSMKK